MLKRLPKQRRRRTVAGDKNYDTKGFVADVRAAGFTSHKTPPTDDPRSTGAPPPRRLRRVPTVRKHVEEPFGWVKTVGAGSKLRCNGNDRNRAWFKMTTAVHNVIRITALDAATT